MMQNPPGMAPSATDAQHYQAHQPPQQWVMPPVHQMPPMWNQQPLPQVPPMWSQQPPPQVPPVPPQSLIHYAAGGTVAPASVAQQPPAGPDEVRTLWIGDLQYWMDEGCITGYFAHTGEVTSVKVIRNRQTGQSEGYGFVEFVNHAAAERTLQTYNGTQIPGTEQNFRLNWASSGGDKRQDENADFHIFVGDLAPDVTDYMLQETFRSRYPSVKSAKVVQDRATGRSKGYGFVRFGDEAEQLRSMTEMNGMFCSTRQMRIGPAQNKKALTTQQQGSYQNSPTSQQPENDPNNTTIFVGNLDAHVTEDNLRQLFTSYGDLRHVKIPFGKRCGFVQFANRNNAEEALLMLNGSQVGGQSIRLSWGRTPYNKQDNSSAWAQPQGDPNQWNSGYYGYGQGYDAYGYARHDPIAGAAYGGYSGYGNYQQQQ